MHRMVWIGDQLCMGTKLALWNWVISYWVRWRGVGTDWMTWRVDWHGVGTDGVTWPGACMTAVLCLKSECQQTLVPIKCWKCPACYFFTVSTQHSCTNTWFPPAANIHLTTAALWLYELWPQLHCGCMTSDHSSDSRYYTEAIHCQNRWTTYQSNFGSCWGVALCKLWICREGKWTNWWGSCQVC